MPVLDVNIHNIFHMVKESRCLPSMCICIAVYVPSESAHVPLLHSPEGQAIRYQIQAHQCVDSVSSKTHCIAIATKPTDILQHILLRQRIVCTNDLQISKLLLAVCPHKRNQSEYSKHLVHAKPLEYQHSCVSITDGKCTYLKRHQR